MRSGTLVRGEIGDELGQRLGCIGRAGRRYLRLRTKQDVTAIVAFLRSLPPVANKVPGPFGPAEAPTSFVMKIVPPPAR